MRALPTRRAAVVKMKRHYTAWLVGLLALLIFCYLYYLEFAWMRDQRRMALAFGEIYKSSIVQVEVRMIDRSYTLLNANPVRKDRYHAQPVFNDTANTAAWSAQCSSGCRIPPAEIDKVLTALIGLTFDVGIPPELASREKQAFGLQAPFAVVTIAYIGGRETLTLGALHKHGDKRYAAISLKPDVYLIAERAVAAVLAPLRSSG